MCRLCTDQGSYIWNVHCGSQQHWTKVFEITNQSEHLAEADLWQTIEVVGGSLKYNHLNGEIHGLRNPREREENVFQLKDLSVPDKWILVGTSACVATSPESLKDHWSNLWSHNCWKHRMKRSTRRLENVLHANGLSTEHCTLCPCQSITEKHLLGPAHFKKITPGLFKCGTDVVDTPIFSNSGKWPRA